MVALIYEFMSNTPLSPVTVGVAMPLYCSSNSLIDKQSNTPVLLDACTVPHDPNSRLTPKKHVHMNYQSKFRAKRKPRFINKLILKVKTLTFSCCCCIFPRHHMLVR